MRDKNDQPAHKTPEDALDDERQFWQETIFAFPWDFSHANGIADPDSIREFLTRAEAAYEVSFTTLAGRTER